jgi:hypothetical protein
MLSESVSLIKYNDLLDRWVFVSNYPIKDADYQDKVAFSIGNTGYFEGISNIAYINEPLSSNCDHSLNH